MVREGHVQRRVRRTYPTGQKQRNPTGRAQLAKIELEIMWLGEPLTQRLVESLRHLTVRASQGRRKIAAALIHCGDEWPALANRVNKKFRDRRWSDFLI